MYSMGNLDLGARPEFNGFAGKDRELFWSSWSITPADCRKRERPLKYPQRVAQSWGLQAGFFNLER